jgi:hypothetical protein
MIMRLTSTTTARSAMTPPDARYKPALGATRGTMPAATHARLTASAPGDAADQPVAFLAAHVQEHSLMLVLSSPPARQASRPQLSCRPADPGRRTHRRRPRSGSDVTRSMPWWLLPLDPLVAGRR